MSGAGLNAADFVAFFNAVWDVEPFPWQQRLLLRLAGEDAGWPDVLNLPTGSGKTAALDIAVFNLALEAHRGEHRRAPLRIAFVVDRRLIVDDAYQRAKRLAGVLDNALESPSKSNPIILKVAQSLCSLAGANARPLVVRRLRGGAPLEEDWAHTPVQPTILCSTVDQVGSRLLFRGYGVSDRMKPIHAGLLGSDCLALVDEAHLAEPFRQTLLSVERLRAPDPSPFDVAVLTATPGNGGTHFALDAADRADPVLAARLNTRKPAVLLEIAGKQGMEPTTRRVEEVARSTKEMLEALLQAGIATPAIGVVLNRVARARAVFERLHRELDAADVLLVIGPARPADRNDLSDRLEPIRTGRNELRTQMKKPLVVVATQTIEAGVDLDFDGLVTEAAAFDALRQRFGRLNRAGRSIATKAVIIAHKEDAGQKADDPVYGDRISKTWTKLRQLASASDVVDFGIEAIDSQIDFEDALAIAAPSIDAPVLLPAYAHLWAQTSPIPNADPEVSLFLHGAQRSPASVQIVWRADVLPGDLLGMHAERIRDHLTSILMLMPPRAAEAIEVPLWAARSWLQRSDLLQESLSDIAEQRHEDARSNDAGLPAFRWAGADGDRTGVVRGWQIRNGDLVVVPADYGGCDDWGWDPRSGESVIDVADRAQAPYSASRFVVRVTPTLIDQATRQATQARTEIDGTEEIPLLEDLSARLAETLAEHAGDEPFDLVHALAALDLPQRIADGLAALERSKERLQAMFPYGFDSEDLPRGVVFVAPRGLSGADIREPSGTPATETEEGSAFFDQPLRLIEHSRHVREWARTFGPPTGLETKILSDVALAAFLHDAGKADPRFQSYFMGGDPYGPDLKDVLAKAGPRRLPRDAWKRAGLPENWRHEALSVRLALIHPEFAQANDKELVLWLIGTHHGFGRPLFPHADPKDADERSSLLEAFGIAGTLSPGHGPQSLGFDYLGRDWSQLFEILKQRYGIWGLARLESLVRLADHRASEHGREPKAEAAPAKETAP
jgi:CRISPR-associated endonuclease/helicase Cas3